MLTTHQINDLHRLYWSEHWPIRKIERHLRMSWRTIKKYLDTPAQAPAQRQRESKLDPFKTTIAEWLEKDPSVTAAVIEQKLRPLGYRVGHTILREYVHTARPQLKSSRAFLRMEPPPGDRFEVDWGHFTSACSITPATSASSTHSPWSKRTAACFTWSSPTVKLSRRSSAATCMRSPRLVASHARLPMTTWRPPSLNMMAGWSVSFRAFSRSPANTVFIQGFA